MAGRQKDDSLATATTLLIAILGALSNAAIPLFTVNIALASPYGDEFQDRQQDFPE